ncbi:Uncharacterized protein FKW44_006557 [Caligus rogercresseyi]|uniref:Uncharacterized protein n=1 Tax=Caligus rogercresseyi TaxID=217165 RepID=A0A7T8QSZ4_CALRO|nr:Uncharacterized protein FKW44_006557 [Caligus rogercresseyi]
MIGVSPKSRVMNWKKKPDMTANEVMHMAVKAENSFLGEYLAYRKKIGVGSRNLLHAMQEEQHQEQKEYNRDPLDVDAIYQNKLPQPEPRHNKFQCVLHPKGNHSTAECRVIKSSLRECMYVK